EADGTASVPVRDRGGPLSIEDAQMVGMQQLAVWAFIEPEVAEVYSTRRLGAPITVLKRMLIRLLRQYIGQISAQQSRFNAHVVAQVMALDDRVRRVERIAESLVRDRLEQNYTTRKERLPAPVASPAPAVRQDTIVPQE